MKVIERHQFELDCACISRIVFSVTNFVCRQQSVPQCLAYGGTFADLWPRKACSNPDRFALHRTLALVLQWPEGVQLNEQCN